MKKLFTIAGAIMFASLGFTASAQTYMDEATVTRAPSGTVTGELVPITLSWGQAISENNFNGTVEWDGQSQAIPVNEFEILNGNTLNIFVGALGLPTGNTYTISIGEGCVKNADGAINPQQVVATFTYEEIESGVYPQKAVFTSPENGIINISWPGVSYVEDIDFDGAYDGVYLTDEAGAQYPLTDQVSQSEDYDALIVDINDMGLATGSYTLVLSQGSIYLEDDDWNAYENAADSYTFSYTGMAAQTYMDEATVTRAPSGTVTGELAPITLSWGQAISENNFNGTIEWDGQSKAIPVDEFEILNGNTLNIFVGALDLSTGYTYSITIGEGCVKNADGAINPQQVVATFTYEEEESNAYSQKAEFEVIENGVINVTWPGISYVEADYPDNLYLTDEEGNVYQLSSSEVKQSEDYDALVINVTDMELASGVYTLVIPEGSIYLEDDDWNAYENAADSYIFSYSGMAAQTYMDEATVTRAPSGTVTGELAPITLSWGQAISENNFNGTIEWDGQSKAIPVDEFEILNGNTLNIFVGALGLSTGYTYTVTIGEGCVKNADGAINPQQVVATFTYEEEESGVYSQEAEFEVIENGVINVSWAGISYVEADYPDELYLTDEEGNVYQLSSSQVKQSEDYDALVIDVTDMELASGVYTLVIPEGSIYLEDDDWNAYTNANEEYTFSYDAVSGINAIGTDNESLTIYNLNGVKVSGDRKQLSNGIYIINGQKVVIRNK
ncbi:MAG: hypothetical protein J1E82_04490 [Muribaculaceae bacterium]|nr:hypothetical protein [Muribaculaceae bacterium]